jgi:small subunit ribosomal protein S1
MAAEAAALEDSQAAFDFAEMLDSYEFDQPKRGQIMTGIVLEASDEEVILDVGAKRDAFVPRTDMVRLDAETLAHVVTGAEIKVYVLQPRSRSGDLIVSIHKALALRDWDRAKALEASGEIIEAQVAGVNRGGLLVDFGRLRGFRR